MHTVTINRLHSRYYLAPGAADQQARLDRIQERVFDTELERALELENVSPRDILCIRRLDVPVDLRLSDGDQSLLQAWSAGLARALRETLRNKTFELFVRYRSRTAALADFLESVTRRNYRRAWAWRQLGFVERAQLESHQQAMAAVYRVCSNEPEQILPVLTALVLRGTFARFASQLPTDAWMTLAGLSLAKSGAPADVLTELHRTPLQHLPRQAFELAHTTARRLDRSKIASAVTQNPDIARSQPDRIGLAVLSLLEADPGIGLLPLGQLRRSIAIAARLIGDKELHTRLTSPAARENPDRPAAGRTAVHPEQQTGLDTVSRESVEPASSTTGPKRPPSAAPPQRTQVREGDLQQPQEDSAPGESGSHRSAESDIFRTGRRSDLSTADTFDVVPVESADQSGSDLWRVAGFTRWGGLLYLIHILDELELPEEMVNSSLYPQRSLPWLLHGTALMLVSAEEDDPAALAFCGLGPESVPPTDGEPPPRDAERQQIAAWVHRILDSLRERLSFTGEDAELIETVCRRRARVVADPGWIEICMSLDDVSTGIRSAGLDLNPEYVPWLGVVMRFVYE